MAAIEYGAGSFVRSDLTAAHDTICALREEITRLIARVEKAEARVKELEAEIAFRPPKAKYPPFSSTP